MPLTYLLEGRLCPKRPIAEETENIAKAVGRPQRGGERKSSGGGTRERRVKEAKGVEAEGSEHLWSPRPRLAAAGKFNFDPVDSAVIPKFNL